MNLSILNKLSLRMRLTAWYSAVVIITLIGFGLLTYFTVSNSLHHNLDTTLVRVTESLNHIIRKKQSELKSPLKPARRKRSRRANNQFSFFSDQMRLRDTSLQSRLRDSTNADSTEERSDEVWSAVYEHILLNSKNFMIQVADTNNKVYWKSENLDSNALPLYNSVEADDDPFDNQVFTDVTINQQKLRIYAARNGTAQITVGYTLQEIEETLSELFAVLRFGLPFALLLCILGGYWLARNSLKPVDDLTRAANDITAHNLSMRLPVPAANDEIKRLTTTLNEMIARLESAFVQIRTFTSDASHELRTPLAIMMGEIELTLRRDHTTEQYKETLNSALEEVQRLSIVVENLLELSRAETGQVKLSLSTVNISKIAEDVCEDLEILAIEKHIELTWNIQPYVTLVADKTRLHQVLLNVIDNAIKYTPERGSVHVSVTVENTNTIIEVRDSGVGIPPEDIEHIFDRFYRVDKARSKDVIGNGLGLSIVKWIVESHKGTISVSSKVGSGTTFSISLPANQV